MVCLLEQLSGVRRLFQGNGEEYQLFVPLKFADCRVIARAHTHTHTHTTAKTPSSGTRPRRIYRQHSRHHLKRQLSQPRLESAHSRLDLFQGRRPPRLESAHSQLDLFQGRRPPRLESAHSRLDLSQGRTGMLSRQESSMTLGSSLNLSMSASLTSRKLQRQAMQV